MYDSDLIGSHRDLSTRCTLQAHELRATLARLNIYRLLALSGWVLLLLVVGGQV